jgi:hypothetical protein
MSAGVNVLCSPPSRPPKLNVPVDPQGDHVVIGEACARRGGLR